MRKAWAIIKGNIGIGQTFSFMAVKLQKTRNVNGREVTIVL